MRQLFSIIFRGDLETLRGGAAVFPRDGKATHERSLVHERPYIKVEWRRFEYSQAGQKASLVFGEYLDGLIARVWSGNRKGEYLGGGWIKSDHGPGRSRGRHSFATPRSASKSLLNSIENSWRILPAPAMVEARPGNLSQGSLASCATRWRCPRRHLFVGHFERHTCTTVCLSIARFLENTFSIFYLR